MRLVIDASVAVKWMVTEPDSDAADRLLDGRHELHAPRLMLYEVGNALWVKGHRRSLERNEAVSLAEYMLSFPIHWDDNWALMPSVVDLALTLDHPVYDCIYLALAHRIGATLVTADALFAEVVTPTQYRDTLVMLGDPALDN